MLVIVSLLAPSGPSSGTLDAAEPRGRVMDADTGAPLPCRLYVRSSDDHYWGDTHVHRRLEDLPNLMRVEDLHVTLPLTFWVREAYEKEEVQRSRGVLNEDAEAESQRALEIDRALAGEEREEREVRDAEEGVSMDVLKASARKAIGIMETSAAEYRNQRQCFSCHHQAVPVLALTLARTRGLTVDQKNLDQQIEHTRAHLERGREDYRAGRGQGGRADTAGWALWTLEVADHPTDETTQSVAEYLLDWQEELGHWSPPSQRPPTEASPFTTTYVALRGITYFAPNERHEARDARIAAARAWLLEASPVDTEDRVFQLRALQYVGADEARIKKARDELASRQRDDGGWAQTSEMTSDAYATATALAALHEAGGLPLTSPVYQRGIRFLLDAQLPDGSWHVVTRSKPVQLYFETGFPYGKDQFLSMAATAWSTYALLLAAESADQAE